MSGFFFCGMIDEPVEKASCRVTKENSFVFQRMISSAIRGEVHADHRGDEGELGDEVPGGRAVDGVADTAVLEAEVLGHGLRVKAQGGAGEGAGAVRRHGRPLVPLAQPLGVPGQGLDVGQDVVGEEHRLGVLEVGTAGHRDVGVGLGQADQGVLEVGDQAADDPGVVAQVHPEEGGDLVVA